MSYNKFYIAAKYFVSFIFNFICELIPTKWVQLNDDYIFVLGFARVNFKSSSISFSANRDKFMDFIINSPHSEFVQIDYEVSAHISENQILSVKFDKGNYSELITVFPSKLDKIRLLMS